MTTEQVPAERGRHGGRVPVPLPHAGHVRGDEAEQRLLRALLPPDEASRSLHTDQALARRRR